MTHSTTPAAAATHRSCHTASRMTIAFSLLLLGISPLFAGEPKRASAQIGDIVQGGGDVNGDESVTTNDLEALQTSLKDATKNEKAKSDTNGDGTTDANDVQYLKRLLARKEPTQMVRVGDVDADGDIDGFDLVLLLMVERQLLPLPGHFTAADVNSDGNINFKDFLDLDQHLSGDKKS